MSLHSMHGLGRWTETGKKPPYHKALLEACDAARRSQAEAVDVGDLTDWVLQKAWSTSGLAIEENEAHVALGACADGKTRYVEMKEGISKSKRARLQLHLKEHRASAPSSADLRCAGRLAGWQAERDTYTTLELCSGPWRTDASRLGNVGSAQEWTWGGESWVFVARPGDDGKRRRSCWEALC